MIDRITWKEAFKQDYERTKGKCARIKCNNLTYDHFCSTYCADKDREEEAIKDAKE